MRRRLLTTPAPSSGVHERWRPWQAWAALAAVLALWSVASPLFSGPDEPAHVTKAAGAARGHLNGPVHTGEGADDPCVRGVDGPTTSAVSCTYYRVPAIFLQSYQVPICYKFRPTVTADCAAAFAGSKDEVLVPSTAANYPPLYYVVTGLPSLLASSVVGVYLMRFMAVAVAAGLLTMALASVSRLPDRVGAAVGLVVATSPMTLFISSVVNPSGMEVCAAVALWAGGLEVLAVERGGKGWALARTAIAASVLAAARPISALWVVLIGVTLLLLARRQDLLAVARSRGAGLAVGAIAGSTVAATIWYLVAAPTSGSSGTGVAAGVSRLDVVTASLSLTSDRAVQMIGRFGWLDTRVPAMTVIVWAAAVAILVMAGLLFGSWRERLSVVWLVALLVALPPAIESLEAYRVGFFWQGRYLLPLAVGLPIVAGHIGLPKLVRRLGSAAPAARNVLLLAIGAGHLAAFAAALDRYSFGEASFFGTPAWSPPLVSPVASVALYAVASAGLGWVLRPLFATPAKAAAVQARQRSGRPPL